MAEVSASFRDVAWFFVDPYGGDAVAVVWKHRDADFKWKVDAKLNFFHQEVKVSYCFYSHMDIVLYIFTTERFKEKEPKGRSPSDNEFSGHA